MGTSRYIRELDVSQNWISNLHSEDVYPWGGTAVQFVWCGDIADAYGPNDVRFNDNTMTFFRNSSGYRNVIFSGVRNLSGTNNKTFRPNVVNTTGDPQQGSQNFLWEKWDSSVIPTNMEITNTFDNGWPGSRLACDDPSHLPQWYFCSLTGKSNQLTWIDNPYRTPEAAPIITNARVVSANQLQIWVDEPNRQPVRVMVYRNDLPIGLRTISQGYGTILISPKARYGDRFYLQAFNENGWHGEYSFTH